MATSASIYSPYGNHSRFYMNWQVASQDITNNRTLINWQAGLEIESGGWYWSSNAVKIYSINIDGSGSLGSGTWSNISGTGQHQLLSGSIWITHNSDGTKSFSASLSGWLYGEGNEAASGSWDVPTIPRNSQVTTSAVAYTLGDPVVINTNRKSTSFTHTITIKMDNASGTVLQTINSVADTTTWTPTSDQITTMQNHIPNSNTLTLYIDQYNNQVKASSNVSVTLSLTEANPTFADFTFKDTDTTTIGVTGNDQILVKGKSVLEVDISTTNKMTAIKGSTADHYSIAYDGASEIEAYSASALVSASFINPQTIGSRTILVSAYDSRGNSTTVSKNITVYDYAAPTITTKLTRENNFDSNTTVHIEGTYTPLNIGGTNKNSLTTSTLQYRYQEDGGTFGSWVTKTFTANTTNGTFSLTDFVVSLDNTKKYNFEFHISDKFGTVTTTNSVDVGTPIMFVGQNNGQTAVSIGSMPVDGATLTILGKNILEMVYPIGSAYWNGSDSRDPSLILGFGTWTALEGVSLGGKSATAGSAFNVAAGTIIGEEKHTLTTAEMPSHTHPEGYVDFSAGKPSFAADSTWSTILYNAGGHGVDNLSTVATGGGGSHNTIHPTKVGYLWQRTA